MHRVLVLFAVLAVALAVTGPAAAAGSAGIAALQVALQAHGQYPASVDGVDGPLTRAGLTTFQKRAGLPPSGTIAPATRRALGSLGRPLLGQRELAVGAVGWDVSSLEFRLVPFGLGAHAVDGRFTAETARALARFQARRGLPQDGIAGKQTFRALSGAGSAAAAFTPPVRATTCRGGRRELLLDRPALRDQPAAARQGERPEALRGDRPRSAPYASHGHPDVADGRAVRRLPGASVSHDAVRASIDHWSAVYGVDPRLARATAWMESGFQPHVVSSVGALGVMQLLPGTWKWVDEVLLGTTTPRTYDGNIRAGVRYLRWLHDQFQGDRRLALAGYYQGAQAVRDRGLFDDTKRYVAVILRLHGSV